MADPTENPMGNTEVTPRNTESSAPATGEIEPGIHYAVTERET